MSKKERPGWEWKNGYWSKVDGARHKDKLPFFCPFDRAQNEEGTEECRRPTSNLDDEYMLKYGVCKRCYIMYVEDREKPLIDTEFYANRLKDRGH